MKYQKRHYEDTAELLRRLMILHSDKFGRAQFNTIKTLFGDLYALDNDRFDRGRFEEACEP